MRTIPDELAARYTLRAGGPPTRRAGCWPEAWGPPRTRRSGCSRRCGHGRERSATSTSPPGGSPPGCGPAESGRATWSRSAEKFGRLSHDPSLSAPAPVVGVVGQDFRSLLAADLMEGVLPADPAGLALIAFTSGTTRDPKGVLHSHQTLGFEVRQGLGRYPPNRGAQLSAAPAGHFIGMLGGLLTT